jgi:hypothetical protein
LNKDLSRPNRAVSVSDRNASWCSFEPASIIKLEISEFVGDRTGDLGECLGEYEYCLLLPIIGLVGLYVGEYGLKLVDVGLKFGDNGL